MCVFVLILLTTLFCEAKIQIDSEKKEQSLQQFYNNKTIFSAIIENINVANKKQIKYQNISKTLKYIFKEYI